MTTTTTTTTTAPSKRTTKMLIHLALVVIALSHGLIFVAATEDANNQCSSSDGSCNVASSGSSVECGVWLGMSTLPGTGIGMFAGRSIKRGDDMIPSLGDLCIPVVDFDMMQDDAHFLWDEYTWNAKFQRADNLGMNEVNVASPGFGAAANSAMDFLNVNEGLPEHIVAQGLRRSKDPGAGAFTPYHARKATARTDIEPGQELFVGYGNSWFILREGDLGPIPITGDHAKAEILFKSFKRLQQKVPNLDLLDDAWDTFVLNSTWSSRIIAALPDKEDYDVMLAEGGLREMKRNRMVRSQEWLENHAVCGDNFYEKESTIPQAGHGAFARRFMKEGTPVLPVPLIHIPDRKILDMYEVVFRDKQGKQGTRGVNIANVVGRQLLLNYCLGHRDSTVLLCAYGPGFNLINHNKTLANVRIQWASPERSNHHPDLLEKSVPYLEDVASSHLAMELVALRDIRPDEEIFLDYGDEWDEAWDQHVRTWKPVEGADEYVSALDMEARNETLRTEFEQMTEPYPSNLSIKFDRAFASRNGQWRSIMNANGDLKRYREREEKFLDKCEIMRYREVDGRILYTAVIPEEEGSKVSILLEDLPREAFIFVDRPHTTDMFLPNAFRHDIRIPDDLFPEAWKNNK